MPICLQPVLACERTGDNQRLQQLKKQMAKLQHEKGNLSSELHALKKKERYQILKKRRRFIYHCISAMNDGIYFFLLDIHILGVTLTCGLQAV